MKKDREPFHGGYARLRNGPLSGVHGFTLRGSLKRGILGRSRGMNTRNIGCVRQRRGPWTAEGTRLFCDLTGTRTVGNVKKNLVMEEGNNERGSPENFMGYCRS